MKLFQLKKHSRQSETEILFKWLTALSAVLANNKSRQLLFDQLNYATFLGSFLVIAVSVGRAGSTFACLFTIISTVY